jgi:hypothetical protein
MECKNGLYKENCLEILIICYCPNHFPRIDRGYWTAIRSEKNPFIY